MGLVGGDLSLVLLRFLSFDVWKTFFLAEDTLIFSLPFSFSFLLAASFDCCFVSFCVRVLSVHSLGY